MTPDELAKAGLEHSEQKALFAWANMAAMFGFEAANNELAYDHRTRDSLFVPPVNMWAYTVPQLKRMFAIHNQGHGDKIRGNRARAEGVKAGVPDIMLPWPKHSIAGGWHDGLFIELKRRKKGRVSDEQNDWLPYLCDAGYIARVAYGWRAAADIIEAYARGKEIPNG